MSPNLQQILTILQIISIIMSLVVTTFGFVLKRELKRLDDADQDNKKQLDELSKGMQKVTSEREKCNRECIQSFSSLKEDINDNYVSQKEFIRIYTEQSKKLDKIYDILFEMKGRERA